MNQRLRWSPPDVVYTPIDVTSIDDFRHYPARQLHASDFPFHFAKSEDRSAVPETVTIDEIGEVRLDDLLETSDTIAFLVIKDDIILYERYLQGHTQSALSQAFSTSKSIQSILIGIAIHDGHITSVDQPVTDFVPELAEGGFDEVSIKDLLQMKSSMDYKENDNPFGAHVRFNYTDGLRAEIFNLRVKKEPDDHFIYKSGEAALLALMLERSLGGKTITQYTQEKLWTPLGMEYDGVWSLDREGNGLEKTWCCLAAAARDFAKFGRLYLRNGDWDGEQIVSRSWVEQSTRVGAYTPTGWPRRQVENGMWNYGYQWWLASKEDGDYWTRGKDGQHIYVNPNKQMIIVRLGQDNGNVP